ncbi:hypothetical protein CEV31_2645 [Brucella thiophenivorans]|uniref:Uncharacterized protein n=1 Tax=Brucella thiophenivorans TaxID=571255 RepID=A0A256FLV8_9HYPH|nr:hypothetical protein CEV31_2645 [Brucella thiophenivorans]
MPAPTTITLPVMTFIRSACALEASDTKSKSIFVQHDA